MMTRRPHPAPHFTSRGAWPAAILASCVLWAAVCADAQAPAEDVASVANEFIEIRVNAAPENTGRFAVSTTGGDPTRASDDNKVLIYGTRTPWTGYATVRVDGQDWVFGGPTQKRAGKSGQYGAVTQPPQVVEGRAITCACKLGPVEVKQELSFARSITTRMHDTTRIAYTVSNTDSAPHSVGVRIMLDTMLGDNDGAPLRIGDRAVTTATSLAAGALPDFWQAFDSLSAPTVTAQGTLRAAGVEPPERMIAVDWGTAADHPWEFPLPEGRDFTRAGEAELDSSALIYWDPRPLPPGASRTYDTFYGLGGITLSAGRLSIGVTAPAEVALSRDRVQPFAIIAYIENSGGFEARDVAATLELPAGLALVSGPNPSPAVASLAPGGTTSAQWMVKPTGAQHGTLKFAVTASSSNIESNRVEREITVQAPPRLELTIEAPDTLDVVNNRYTPNPFQIGAVVTNTGTLPAQAVAAGITLPAGLELDRDAKAVLGLDTLGAGKSHTFTWEVTATGLHIGNLTYSIVAESPSAEAARAEKVISVPMLTPELRFFPEGHTVPLQVDGRSAVIPIEVRLSPAREFHAARFTITYDPKVIEPLFTSRGEAFVDAGRLLSPWRSGAIDRENGVIAGVEGLRTDAAPLTVLNAGLVTVTFRAIAPGTSPLTLKDAEVFGPDGRPIEFKQFDGSVTVAPSP
ncbi:MAG: hypothetical protein JSV65_03190 [Armatimonadota bacterium]|nr:MAG: hypothetical protein JSV65_03190 [Armatimonadota bacterium]